ncbi:hypothetical protein J6590_038356 [Homalodisca vitripennis]|nr:hypothetical protein J6590_038356 [Homalodisca vitripennis]
MDLPRPPTRFQKYNEIISKSIEEVAENFMVQAAREAIIENEDGKNIAACFDGTWQKRGHKSLNGVFTVTSMDAVFLYELNYKQMKRKKYETAVNLCLSAKHSMKNVIHVNCQSNCSEMRQSVVCLATRSRSLPGLLSHDLSEFAADMPNQRICQLEVVTVHRHHTIKPKSNPVSHPTQLEVVLPTRFDKGRKVCGRPMSPATIMLISCLDTAEGVPTITAKHTQVANDFNHYFASVEKNLPDAIGSGEHSDYRLDTTITLFTMTELDIIRHVKNLC